MRDGPFDIDTAITQTRAALSRAGDSVMVMARLVEHDASGNPRVSEKTMRLGMTRREAESLLAQLQHHLKLDFSRPEFLFETLEVPPAKDRN